ncbi:MAG: hypothetical protein IPP09_05805 [Elusimicrobia bacterium]|nr:hypothetical protein [Elusimicrobiota bacterium]
MLRLLDANLNRAREGLRVLEDTARFRWDDRPMFQGFAGPATGWTGSPAALTRRWWPAATAPPTRRADDRAPAPHP